jgi:hypothetical protein
MGTTRKLWPEDVAARLHVTVRTVRKMLAEARKRDKDKTTRPRDLPLPNGYERRPVWNGRHYVTTLSPWWRDATIGQWEAQRPGPGGPGQKRGPRRAHAAGPELADDQPPVHAAVTGADLIAPDEGVPR